MMDFKMDLQLFAEGEGATSEDSNASHEGTQQNDDSSEGENVEIPDELAGVSEDIAREILAEANVNDDSDSSESDDSAGNHGHYESSTAEADSDNKQYDDEYMPKANVPYKRFKQQIDKNHDLEGQIKALKEQLENYNSTRSNQAATDDNQQAKPQAAQQPIITADVAKKMKEIVQAEAMNMTGFSKDDVEALDWMDDDDNRKQTWSIAYKMAENSIQQKIAAARQQQFENSRRIMAAHNQAVIEYNNFAKAESNEPDFREIQNYAINDYFEKQSKAEQPVIAAAYQRIEANTASPQDIMLIKRYFSDAKRAYRNNHKGNIGANKMSNKFKQSKSFPRSNDIEGASVDTGSVTADTLAKMLEEKPFSEIPPEYQKMLLGY